MTKFVTTALLSALCIAGAHTAFAAKQCDIVGKFTDSLGSSGKFVSQTKGNVSNSAICPSSYRLTVTKLTETVINLKGSSMDKSCGKLSGKFTFNDGGCQSATGTITIAGLGSFPDTVTRTGKDAGRGQEDNSALTSKLK